MRHRRLTLIAAAVTAALAAALGAVAIGAGSSHREAPLTSLDPTADDTDVYAYVANDAQDAVTLVANWVPFEDPAGGPNFYRFDDRAHYYINVDNTGDGKLTSATCSSSRPRPEPNSFLYALPAASTRSTDPNLNVHQTYSVTREDLQGQADVPQASSPERPGGAEQRRPEDDPRLQRGRRPGDQACRAAARCSRASATTRSSSTSARRSTRSTSATAPATTAAARTTSPATTSTRSCSRSRGAGHARTASRSGSDKAKNAVVGVWSSTERTARSGHAAEAKRRRQGTTTTSRSSRLGNPLVNEVVIPLGLKDQFNRTQPADDAATTAKYVLNPELARLHQRAVRPRRAGDRPDGHRPGAAAGRPGPQPADAASPVDTIKLNLGTCPPSRTRTARRARRRHAGLPERSASDRRRGRHRAARRRRRAERQQRAARRRSGPERQAVLEPVPVPGTTDSGLRLGSRSAPSRRTDPVPERRRT